MKRKILISSYAFAPSIGGIETVTAILADEFANRGHDVKVITQTAGPDTVARTFSVLRRPSSWELIQAVWWCDVFIQNNISLRSLWAGLLLLKPTILIHQTWLFPGHSNAGATARLKAWVLPLCANVAISEAVAVDLPPSTIVIGNPFRDDVFQAADKSQPKKCLLFLGRLVSDKGLDVLIVALGLLRGEGRMPTLTVVGSGPEERAIQNLAREHGVDAQVNFLGSVTGNALAAILAEHEILVIPSRWPEPFGIVALEGIASGCIPIGSEEGGLKEAIGACGLTFPNGDARALATALEKAMGDGSLRERCRSYASEHLERFKRGNVAAAYLKIIEDAISRKTG